MDHAVDTLGWTDIIHCIDDDNSASQRVAQRLGSSLLGAAHLPPPTDEDIGLWGQTAAQWRARRAAIAR
jgi:RimJ/RimL family protein N-acetyltransferase